MLVNLRGHKIERVCADERRPTIAQPWLDTDNSVLVATDGIALAVVPVDLSLTDAAGPIPLLALAAARQKSSKDHTADIACNGTVDVPDAGATFERPAFEELPDWAELLAENGEPRVEIMLSARILWDLAQALGTDAVTLRIYGPETPIHVEAVDGGRGLLMPIARRA